MLSELNRKYFWLRLSIGLIMLLLPLVLYVSECQLPDYYKHTYNCPLTSMSAYYYSDLRDVLVGSYIATGLLLFFYHGYQEGNVASFFDVALARIGGISAILLAITPHYYSNLSCKFTQSLEGPCFSLPRVILAAHTGHGHIASQAHTILAFTLLFPMLVFTIFIFPIDQSKSRKLFFYFCGLLIGVPFLYGISRHVLWLYEIRLDTFVWIESAFGGRLTFWIEAIMLVGFGLAWIAKSQFDRRLFDRRS